MRTAWAQLREHVGLRGAREWVWLVPVLILLVPVPIARMLLLPFPGGIPMSLLGTIRFLMRWCAYPMAWSLAATLVAAGATWDSRVEGRFKVTLWALVALGWLIAVTTAGRMAAL